MGFGISDERLEMIRDEPWEFPRYPKLPKISNSPQITQNAHKKRSQKTHIVYTTAELSKEITDCLWILNLCDKQDKAIDSFFRIHTPRSRSFNFWFEFAVSGISNRRQTANNHLLQLPNRCNLDVAPPVVDLPIESSLLDYLIKHIIEDELQYQTADKTELINIIEDATYYISNIKGTPLVWDKTNSIWMNYVKEKYPSSIRYDHCCSRCGGELFTRIPYCMSCNSILQ